MPVIGKDNCGHAEKKAPEETLGLWWYIVYIMVLLGPFGFERACRINLAASGKDLSGGIKGNP